MKRGKNFFQKHWLILTMFLILIAWMVYSYINKSLIYILIKGDVENLLLFLKSFEGFTEIIFVLLVILEVVLAPMPPLILYIVAGALFGGFYGGILVFGGNLIGAFIDFKIARNFDGNFIQNRMDKRMQKKFNKFFDKYGALSIFILRINPLTTSDLVSYLSGFTKIKTYKFLLATMLGLIPMIFIQTYFGDIITKNHPVLFGLMVIFSILYLVLFIALIIFSSKKN